MPLSPIHLSKLTIKYPYIIFFIIPISIILFFLLKKNFIRFKSKYDEIEYTRKNRRFRKFILTARTLAIFFLLVAASSPFTSKQKIIPGDTSLIILSDESRSFEVFDKNLALTLKEKIKSAIPTRIKTISYGNSSPLGDAILNNLKGDDNIFLITDGNNNEGKELGDVMMLASTLNSTISALEVGPIKNDISVFVDGPSEIIFGTDYTYFIDVRQVGNPLPYKVKLKLDGEVIYEASGIGSKTFEYKPEKWLLEGYHKVVGEIEVNEEDYFKENNVFYKTIHVYPRPKILFVTKGTSVTETPRIERVLEQVYTYTQRNYIPDDLSAYSAVVINDLNAEELNAKLDILSDYLTNGGGLVVLGGKNSFDLGNYKNSLFETLMPVVVGVPEGKEKDNDVNVVIVIDISGTTTLEFGGSTGSTKISVQKAQAIEILKNLKPEYYVGVVAFDTQGYFVPAVYPYKLRQLKDMPYLNDSIRILKSDPHAGTFIYAGLKKAYSLLEGVSGAKKVFLISDGITQYPGDAYSIGNIMKANGVNIYTIGIGKDTNVEFMQKLAYEYGDGKFFQPEENEKLRIELNTSAAMPSKSNAMVIIDNHHFITQDLALSATLSGYNQVAPKPSARTLIVTNNVYPILTVWRFGLGRVAAVATNTEYWAGELLSKDNSEMTIRTINWAIGSLVENKDFEVITKDVSIGETADIFIHSKIGAPEHEKIHFSKVGETLYKGSFTPKETGFYDFFEASLAAGYQQEYSELGLNPDLSSLITASGGKTFKLNETDKLIDFVKESSKRAKVDVTYYRWPFVIIGVIFFLIEIFFRRLREDRMRV